MVGKKTVVYIYLDRASHENILYAEALVSLANTLGLGTGKDGDGQSALHGILYGIAIADVYRAHGFAVGMQGDGLAAQHTIHIKYYCLDGSQVVVYHLASKSF